MTELPRKKPFFLSIATSLLGLLATIGPVAIIAILAIAGLGNGPYTIDGRSVAKAEFLGFVFPFVLVYLGACLLGGLAAWSIHSENPASRPQLIAFLLAPFLSALVAAGGPESIPSLVPGLLTWLVVPAIAWVYLYRLNGVVAYYEELKAKQSRTSPSSEPTHEVP